jgi:glucose-6-phosphate isomerase
MVQGQSTRTLRNRRWTVLESRRDCLASYVQRIGDLISWLLSAKRRIKSFQYPLMKLRKNILEPLRFDPSGSFNEQFGVNRADVDQLAVELEKIRDAMIGPELAMLAGKLPTPPARQPLDVGFFPLPKRLLDEYELDRRGSELGRLFKLANRIQALADRVVVLGIGGSHMGARALMEGCCQPYWNELSRGQRGSKPRLYFEGNNFDNDATQGLLYLLGAHEDKVAKDEYERWGLVVISKSGETLETATAFRQFLAALEKSCAGDAAQVSDLLVPVTGAGGKLDKMVRELGCQEIFTVPEGVGGRYSIFSAVGLVPAALLGINVIELLMGAVAMNDHFSTAPAAQNIILQYVAVNHLLEKQRGINIRVMSVWSKALECVGLWYDQLSAESLGKNELGFTPLTTVNTRDLHSRHQQHQQGKRDKVFNNFIVDDYRFDDLPIGARTLDYDSLNEIANKSLPDVMRAAVQGTNQALLADRIPFTNLHIPRVDELHLGQLFQMLMLATAVEGRLIGVNPYGQPGVEAYKKNMNRLLGRA